MYTYAVGRDHAEKSKARYIHTLLMKQIWEVSETDPSYEDVEKKSAPQLQKSSRLLAIGSLRRSIHCGGTILMVSMLKCTPHPQHRKLTSVTRIWLNVASCLLTIIVLHRNICTSLNSCWVSALCKKCAPAKCEWSEHGFSLLSFAHLLCYQHEWKTHPPRC